MAAITRHSLTELMAGNQNPPQRKGTCLHLGSTNGVSLGTPKHLLGGRGYCELAELLGECIRV